MGITKDNLEIITNLLKGLHQRNEAIEQIASNLASGTFWRSPDGKLAIEIDPISRKQLEGIIRLYAGEAKAIILTIESIIGDGD